MMRRSNLSRSARLLMRITLLTGALLPTAVALVAGMVLTLQGQDVVGWREAAVMTALPTVFVVLPIYLLLAFVMYLLLSRTGNGKRSDARTHMALGALAGMTAVLAFLLYGLFEAGQVSLLALVLPLVWGVAALSASAGAGVGWIAWKIRRRVCSTLEGEDDAS